MPKQLTQGERLVKIETDIDYIKKEITSTCAKLDNFIDCADDKYTHREEFDEFKEQVIQQKSATRSWVQWIPGVLIGIFALIIAFVG